MLLLWLLLAIKIEILSWRHYGPDCIRCTISPAETTKNSWCC